MKKPFLVIIFNLFGYLASYITFVIIFRNLSGAILSLYITYNLIASFSSVLQDGGVISWVTGRLSESNLKSKVNLINSIFTYQFYLFLVLSAFILFYYWLNFEFSVQLIVIYLITIIPNILLVFAPKYLYLISSVQYRVQFTLTLIRIFGLLLIVEYDFFDHFIFGVFITFVSYLTPTILLFNVIYRKLGFSYFRICKFNKVVVYKSVISFAFRLNVYLYTSVPLLFSKIVVSEKEFLILSLYDQIFRAFQNVISPFHEYLYSLKATVFIYFKQIFSVLFFLILGAFIVLFFSLDYKFMKYLFTDKVYLFKYGFLPLYVLCFINFLSTSLGYQLFSKIKKSHFIDYFSSIPGLASILCMIFSVFLSDYSFVCIVLSIFIPEILSLFVRSFGVFKFRRLFLNNNFIKV